MEYDPTRMCEMLVGLGDVEVLGIEDKEGAPLRVRIRRRVPRPPCGGVRRAVVVRRGATGGAGGPPRVRPPGAAGVAQAPLALPPRRLRGGQRH